MTFFAPLRPDGLGPDSPTTPTLGHPLARLVAYVGLGLIAFVCLATLGLAWQTPGFAFILIAAVAVLAFAYAGVTRVLERRAVFELAPGRALGAVAGLIVGLVAVLIVVATLWVSGRVEVDGFRGVPWTLLLLVVVNSALVPAVLEEIFFRGIIYRLVEEWAGSWIALAASALIFGAAHAANPSASVASIVYIAVEAGLLAGALYLRTRSLWVVMGWHFAWNATLVTLGLPLSGTSVPGLWRWRDLGPTWLTGGSFGIEASPVSAVLLLAVAATLLVVAHRKKLIVAPSWRRRSTPTQ